MVTQVIIATSTLIFLMAGTSTATESANVDKDLVHIPRGEFTMGSNEHVEKALTADPDNKEYLASVTWSNTA
jgi:formylglycine-generating enzyme required for sulfatase activity